MEPQDGTRALLLCEDRGDGPGTHRGPHPTMLTRLQTCEHPRLLRTSQRPSLLVARRHAHVHPSQLSTSREPLAGTKTPAVFNMTHQPGCWAPCRGRVAPRSHPSQTLSCWDSAQGPSRASALGEARITGRGGRGFHRFSVLSICLPTRRGRAVEPSDSPPGPPPTEAAVRIHVLDRSFIQRCPCSPCTGALRVLLVETFPG